MPPHNPGDSIITTISPPMTAQMVDGWLTTGTLPASEAPSTDPRHHAMAAFSAGWPKYRFRLPVLNVHIPMPGMTPGDLVELFRSKQATQPISLVVGDNKFNTFRQQIAYARLKDARVLITISKQRISGGALCTMDYIDGNVYLHIDNTPMVMKCVW
jgi:hypothetical protein